MQVRSGASDERLDYLGCDTTTSETFQTKSRWLWIKFKSDDANTNTGFSADYSLIRDSGEGFSADYSLIRDSGKCFSADYSLVRDSDKCFSADY